MSENINLLVDSDTLAFETQVMLSAIRDPDFYANYSGVLCCDPKLEGGFQNDFNNPADNTIYRALRRFRLVTSENPCVPRGEDLWSILNLLVTEGVLVDTDVALAVPRLQELYLAPANSSAFVAAGMLRWLTNTRQSKSLARATAGLVNYEDLMADMQTNRDVVQQSVGEQTAFTFKQAAQKSQEDDRPRYRTGIKGLDNSIGGGLAKQEFTLIVCPSGGGKTVEACNLAYQLTSQELKGILVTTEQPPHELVPRFVTSVCDIPFDLIKDGVRMEKLNPGQQVKVEALYEHMEKSLVMVDWGQSDHSVETEMMGEIRKAEKMLGKVDFVILDWIGGSLGQKAKDKPEHFRRILKDAADAMDRIGKKADVISVGFAQATTMLAKNKKKVDRTMLGECKTMHEKATNLFGISALTAETDDDSDAPTYQDKQYFFIDKARKGKGGCITVRRDFAYQRFRNWGE